MRSDATHGEFEGFDVKNEAGCSWEGEATTSESRVHLSDILEMLIRLDQQEIFMNPLDDLCAPDYLKVIKKPMCFQRMREKIHSEQYTSWTSFVEDFESICHNAMNFNEKRTKIWNAANLLLRQGRRCLEQQSARCGKFLGVTKVHKDMNVQEEIAPKVRLDRSCQGTRFNALNRNLDKPSCFTSIEKLLPNFCERQGPISAEGDSTISEMVVRENRAVSFTADPSMKSLHKDVNVETLTLDAEEDTRLNVEDQATECSSSFSDTQSEVEGDNSCEEESQFRNGDGNGAGSSSRENCLRRRKRAMKFEWKTCKRGIEWRCRWLELQIKELQFAANKYSRVLRQAKIHGGNHYHNSTTTRTSSTNCNRKTRVLRRRQRRRAEDIEDLMSKHPLFSRYGEKHHQNQELSSYEEGARDDNHIIEFHEFDFEDEYEDNIVVAEDSMEFYLWQLEALQMHIFKLKKQLIREPTVLEATTDLQLRSFEPFQDIEFESPQNFDTMSPQLHSPFSLGVRAATRDLKGHGGSSSRRRNSDFDINNVIMPDTVMANYIEPARHTIITTPHWRPRGEISAHDDESSSEENTDDECYEARHAQMQVKEMQQQCTPLPLNRSRSISFAKERPKIATVCKRLELEDANTEKTVAAGFPSSPIFGHIPKRKRRPRKSREIAESANNVQSQPHISLTEINRVRTRSRSNKHTNSQDDL